MTIKRRLFLSNVLMIVVPALVTALTGLLCMVMVVSVLRQGSGLGYEEGGELAWIGRTCREVLQEAPADSGSREIRQIVSLLDGSAMRLVLTEDGIAEEGTHKELLERNGVYAHLYQLQF